VQTAAWTGDGGGGGSSSSGSVVGCRGSAARADRGTVGATESQVKRDGVVVNAAAARWR
jgi:hypothetical protein